MSAAPIPQALRQEARTGPAESYRLAGSLTLTTRGHLNWTPKRQSDRSEPALLVTIPPTRWTPTQAPVRKTGNRKTRGASTAVESGPAWRSRPGAGLREIWWLCLALTASPDRRLEPCNPQHPLAQMTSPAFQPGLARVELTRGVRIGVDGIQRIQPSRTAPALRGPGCTPRPRRCW